MADTNLSDETIVHPGHHGTARATTFGYVTTDHPRMDRIQNAISAGCGYIAGLAVLAMVFVTLAEVVARTFLNAPLGWSLALLENILLPAAAFFGTVTAYRSGAHVAVVSVFEKMSVPGKKTALLAAYLLVGLGMAALAVTGFQATVFAFQAGTGPVPGSSQLLIPEWVWRSMVPVSMGLGMIVVAIDIWREISGPWSRIATDYEPGDETDRAIIELAAPSTSEPSADSLKRTDSTS